MDASKPPDWKVVCVQTGKKEEEEEKKEAKS